MRILRFLVWRFAALTAVLIGVVTLTFVLGNIIPANPVAAAVGPRASQETIEKVKAEFGLDRPLPEQYARYFWNLLHGDFGRSIYSRRAVAEDLGLKIPATVELAIAAFVMAVGPGIVLGVMSAVKRDRFFDNLSRLIAIVGVSSPNFWTGLVLQLLLAGLLGLFPITGRIGSGMAPTRITGLFLVDSLLTGNWPAFVSSVEHIVLPAITLGIPVCAIVMRLTRSAMLDVLQRDYVMNARVSGGLPERIVVYKYALKNGLVGITSQIGLNFAWLLGGSILVEQIFDWPGLGLYAVQSALNDDLRPIMAATLVASVIYGVVNAFTDLVYTWLDPRISI